MNYDESTPAQFDGIEFPVVSWQRSGGLRFRAHEYNKQPGDRKEKNGRRGYVYRFGAVFTDTSRKFPELFPDTIRALVSRFESGMTAELVTPIWGTARAFCSNWNEAFDAKITSGEVVDLEFQEDDETILNIKDLVIRQRFSAIDDNQAFLDSVRKAYEETSEEKSLLDKIDAAATVVKQVIGEGELTALKFLSKVERLVGLCEYADRTLVGLADPKKQPVLDSMLDLWHAAVSIREDFQSKSLKIQTYTVPKRMTISEVSNAIYGDTFHVDDLMTLNALPDFLAISAGTAVQYYPE